MTTTTATNFEASAYYSYEFEPEADFKQFLAEAKAKKSAMSSNNTAASAQDEDSKLNRAGETPKKSRKSWRRSLFSWLKTRDNKNKMTVDSLHDTTVPKFRREFASGPVRSNITGIQVRSRKPFSGPLSSLFNTPKKEGGGNEEVPYSCLKQLNTPHDAQTQSYGPLYLVT